MRVNVLHEVLALREGSVADLALEPLEGLVDVDEVALEAVEGRKAAIAVILEATELFLLWVLTFKHSLEFFLNLTLGFTGQFHAFSVLLNIISFSCHFDGFLIIFKLLVSGIVSRLMHYCLFYSSNCLVLLLNVLSWFFLF